MRRDVGGDGGDLLGQALPLGQRNGGITRVGPGLAQERAPVHGVLALEVGQHRVHGVLALVHGRDEALAAFERKAFLAHVLGVQEALQALGRRQAVQDALLLVGVEARLAADAFELLLPPALLRLVGDVHVLGADGAAVGLAQRVHQLAQRHAFLAVEGVARVEHGFLVGIAEAVERGLQLGNGGALGALEGIQIGPALAHVAVRGDQLLDGGALAAQVGIGTCGHHHLGAALLGTLGESVDDGQVGHIAHVAAIGRRHMLKCVKVFAPVVWHAARVGQIVLVHLFDVGRIAAEEVGIALVGLVDRCRLAHISRTSVSLRETLAGWKTFRDTAEPIGGCDCGWGRA